MLRQLAVVENTDALLPIDAAGIARHGAIRRGGAPPGDQETIPGYRIAHYAPREEIAVPVGLVAHAVMS
jgi:hypothetical protein